MTGHEPMRLIAELMLQVTLKERYLGEQEESCLIVADWLSTVSKRLLTAHLGQRDSPCHCSNVARQKQP